MPTERDKRRLTEGAAAKRLRDPNGPTELQEQLAQLTDAIAAMQSLDDLGSPELNDSAWADMVWLQRRREALLGLAEGGDRADAEKT